VITGFLLALGFWLKAISQELRANSQKGEFTMAQKWIYRLKELRSEHNELVGKKCANLGEMMHMGIQVPPDFAISVDGYERFMDETGAGEEIRKYVEDAGDSIHKIEKQVEAGRTIRGIIEGKDMPEAMKHELHNFYAELCQFQQPDPVPHRSD